MQSLENLDSLVIYNHLTPIAKLSGGQKSRVVFTSISMSKPHILLLDEPNNQCKTDSAQYRNFFFFFSKVIRSVSSSGIGHLLLTNIKIMLILILSREVTKVFFFFFNWNLK